MRAKVYLPDDSTPRQRESLLAMAEGMMMDVDVSIVNHDDEDVPMIAVIGSWESPLSKAIVERQRSAGRRVLLVKKGFIQADRNFDVPNYQACGWDGHVGEADYCNENSPPDRWQKLRIVMRPWRSNGKHVLLIGQVPDDGNCFDVDIFDWCRDTVIELQRHTDRQIVFRPHPMFQNSPNIPGTIRSKRPLHGDITGAWAVVTYTSTTGAMSAIDGIPVFAARSRSIAWGIANHDVAHIESPAMPAREQWAYNLAYCQWTVPEIKDGLAWRHLRKKFYG